jgi:amino acid transporter
MTGPAEPEPWQFAGWGSARRITDLALLDPSQVKVHHLDTEHRSTLGTWASTAICGNDITSSCLYVSALCAAQAGPYAPIALALVAAVLYLFRSIYAEVLSALPLNGGTYTVLLNTTNKRLAAAAACLTLLSYVATAVISASEAMHYAHNLWHGLDVFSATLGLLAFFALLNLIGISESALVALLIFAFHMLSLIALSVACGLKVLAAPQLLAENWSMPPPGGLDRALFFGFSAAMLGISGFESSANFIEEQKEGVFPKTLRNMWVAVAVFNPLISLLSLGMLPLAEIRQVPPDLLSQMGERAAGSWLSMLVSVDAVLVLSGAVLTSFVGVVGLIRRMALDRCLPEALLRVNERRGTNHYIILAFFALCCSILVATRGDVGTLAGVYTLSFLSVMALFALGNMLLKIRRGRLPRSVRAGWLTTLVALLAVLAGLIGNVLLDPAYVHVFALYFVGALAVVGLMLLRVSILRAFLFASRGAFERIQAWNGSLASAVARKIQQVNARPIVYFTRGDRVEQLNHAALYVLDNEQTNHLMVVHVYKQEADIPDGLAEQLAHIDKCYPELRIDFMAVQGTFGPALIELLSARLGVPKNYMFIGTPSDRFSHRVEQLGGVRLIL